MPEAGAHVDEGEGDEEEGERGEAPGALPAHRLQRRHVVLRHELLLEHHLRRHDHLRAEDEHVAQEDVCRVVLAVRGQTRPRAAPDGQRGVAKLGVEHAAVLEAEVAAFGGCSVVRLAGLLVHHVGHPDCDQASDDEDHPGPLEPGEASLEEHSGEDACEDDDRPADHLEGAGVGEGEAGVLEAGRRHVAQRRRQEDQRVEPLGRVILCQWRVGGLLLAPAGPPPREPEGHHAHHLAQEHSCNKQIFPSHIQNTRDPPIACRKG